MEDFSFIYKGIKVTLKKTKNRAAARTIINHIYGEMVVSVGARYSFDKAKEFAIKVINNTNLDGYNCLYGDNKYCVLFGKKYPIRIIQSTNNGSAFSDKELLIATNGKYADIDVIKSEIKKHYYSQLKAHLLRVIPECERYVNLECSGWKLVETLFSWATCNHKTKFIKFSISLATQNFQFIETVVIHELGHIMYNNHGKEFNDYMKKYVPEYRKILKSNKKSN
ncbi:MAG: M48 family metallopeptidase [Clostridia bacterium]|nr:M48 family metallopeptidase [Clostridia bacterium]